MAGRLHRHVSSASAGLTSAFRSTLEALDDARLILIADLPSDSPQALATALRSRLQDRVPQSVRRELRSELPSLAFFGGLILATFLV